MHLNKLVSVIIPARNRSAYIGDAIKSALEQELPTGWTMEIIVVDDGSTDDTVQVLKKYGKKVQVLEQPVSGAAVARNLGISHARGELIAFLDSDDMWVPGKLKIQLPYFDNKTVGMVHGLAEIMDKNGVSLKRTHLAKDKVVPITNLHQLLNSNVIATSTSIVRKELLEQAGLFDESGVMFGIEDYGLWLRLVTLKNIKILALDKIFSRYREHDQNLSNIGFEDLGAVDFQVKALKRILGVFEHILFNATLSDEQVELFETAIVEQVDRIGTLRNPQFIGRPPTISVILPAYNAGKLLRATINSVLAQTLIDFELLVFDDGSKDDTAEVIRSYDDPRIKLYRQRNKGLVNTCIKGVRLARAEYIARHDADDISLPSRFEKEAMLLAARPEVGLVSTFFTYMDESSETKGITMAYPFKSIDVKRSFYMVNTIGHGSALIRKSVLEAVNGFSVDFTPAEDYHLWTKIAHTADIAIIPESLYWYRISSGGMAASRYDELVETADAINKHYWQQKFQYKKLSDILKDAKYYRSLDNPHAQAIYEQYVNQQIHIAKGLSARQFLGPKIKMKIAVSILNSRKQYSATGLVKKLIRKILRHSPRGRKTGKIK